ncbi:MAG: hypothetical protein WCG42_07615, partial [Parachlamydiaceae bacterium]
MSIRYKLMTWSILALFITGCSSSDDNFSGKNTRNQKGEYIYRRHNESFFITPPPLKMAPPTYSWDQNKGELHRLINKEHFRCKGNSLNPSRSVEQNGEMKYFYDCNGIEKHGLPLRDGKEFVYPILIDLANYIQNETKKKVVITSGHRCPEHNAYVDYSPSNQYSKHMVGAEMSFYVVGMEMEPEKIITVIQQFYKKAPFYRGKKEYEEFQRYEKENTDVSVRPWFNKEIFIKIFNIREGRNLDNQHKFPYISIQVRHDKDLNEKVTYSWDKALRN